MNTHRDNDSFFQSILLLVRIQTPTGCCPKPRRLETQLRARSLCSDDLAVMAAACFDTPRRDGGPAIDCSDPLVSCGQIQMGRLQWRRAQTTAETKPIWGKLLEHALILKISRASHWAE